jgi:glycerol-3-phosphate cytidylyltransferase
VDVIPTPAAGLELEPELDTDGSSRRPGGAGRVGYAAGAFDLFHIGHLNLLRHASARCDHLIAGVVSDEMLQLTKGISPVVPLAERLEIVRHIDVVDGVHAETVPDKMDVWRELRFDVFFKGDDWRGTEKGLRLEREFGAVGVEVVYFPYTMSTSSTVLRRALRALSGTPGHGAEPLAGGDSVRLQG